MSVCAKIVNKKYRIIIACEYLQFTEKRLGVCTAKPEVRVKGVIRLFNDRVRLGSSTITIYPREAEIKQIDGESLLTCTASLNTTAQYRCQRNWDK